MRLALYLFAASVLAEDKAPQFSVEQKLALSQQALRAAASENQARQASEQANQLIATAKAENEKYAELVKKMLAEVKAPAECSVDIQQTVVCPSKK